MLQTKKITQFFLQFPYPIILICSMGITLPKLQLATIFNITRMQSEKIAQPETEIRNFNKSLTVFFAYINIQFKKYSIFTIQSTASIGVAITQAAQKK
jgi:hypothetical protein